MSKQISIITAAYNCGPYLKECIKSVRKQGFKDYEHLILNDQSTDDTRRILKKQAISDKRIRIISPPKRLRCGSAYRLLSREAQGDVIGVLDADDVLTSNSIETLLKHYNKYKDVDYIWTQFWLCDQRLRKQRRGFSSHPGKLSLLDAGMKGKHNFSHWRTFRRRLLEKGDVFPEGLKAAVDKYMGYSLEELGHGAFLNKPLYYYRQRVGGLSFRGRKQWKIMKKKFFKKRQEEGIVVYPIRKWG